MAKRLGFGKVLKLGGVVSLIAAPVIFAQTNAPSSESGDSLIKTETFEVASIRADKPSEGGRISSRIGYLPNGTFTATGVTMEKLVCLAYGVEDYQITGAPAWFSSDRFTVEAKADSAVVEQLPKLSDEERKLVGEHMMQAMLADRVKLALHKETRTMSILALVPAKNGPTIHQAIPGDTYPKGLKDRDGNGHAGMMRFGNGQVTAQGVPLDKLAAQLTEQLHQVVLNKTGLNGLYDFTLKWTSDEDHDRGAAMQPSETGATLLADSDGTSIYAAIQEQLGLKLESEKGEVPVLVVDHADRPSEN